MSSSKVTALGAITDPNSTDILYIVDDPGGTAASKKVTTANVITKAHGLSDGVAIIASNVLTSDTTPDLGTPSACVLTNATGYPGDASLVTVGTIASGVWQGTAIDGAYIDIEGTEIKSTGEAGGTKFLREDGDGTCSWQTVAAGGNTLDQAYDQGGAGAGKTITADSGAVDIDSTTGALDIDGTETTQTLVDVASDTLTTGKLARFYSNSADTGVRNLVEIINDNAAGNKATALYIQNDGTGNTTGVSLGIVHGSANSNGIEIEANALSDRSGISLTCTQSSITAGHGMIIDLDGNTSAATATSEGLGLRVNTERNQVAGAGLADDYDSVFFYREATQSNAATTTTSGTVLNIQRKNESNNAGADLTASGSVLYVENVATQTAGTLTDTVKGIEVVMSANGVGTGIDVTTANASGSAMVLNYGGTTGCAMQILSDTITADAGRASLLDIYSNSGDTGTRSLVTITNDNAAASGCELLTIDQDGDDPAVRLTSAAVSGNDLLVSSGVTTGTASVAITGNSVTTGAVLRVATTGTTATSGNIAIFDATSTNITADKTDEFIEVITSRTYGSTSTRSDDYDSMRIYRAAINTNASGTMNSAGSLLKLESASTETDGTLNADFTALEIDHNAYHANDVYAVKITCNNADSGAAGGIDMSSFSVDEPLIKAVDDAVSSPGTLTKQIAVDVGGTTYYLYAYTTGS
jgi:hypothetical protein